MKKKTLSLLLVLSLTLALLAGCSSDGAGGGSVDTLTFGESEWTGMDIYQLTSSTGCQDLVVSSLLTRLPDGTFGPGIAESYTVSDDGKTITLIIPDDFKYADGDTLTPEDVKRSIEWGLEISPYNIDYVAISDIAIDGQTITLTLDEYAPSVQYTMASTFMPVIPAKQLDSMTAEELLWGARPYGAYSLEEYVEGSHVTLKANPNYKTNNPAVENKGAMNVDTITVRFFNDDFAIMNSVVAGEVDMALNYPATMLADLEKNEDVTSRWVDDVAVYRIFLNEQSGIFADANVREGFMHLIDHAAIAEYSEGILQPAYSYLAPGTMDYSEEADKYFKENYDYDKEKGLQMLADAGWSDTDGDGYLDKDGQQFTFTFNLVDDPTNKQIAEVLQIKLWEVGVNMELATMDGPSLRESVKVNDDYDAALFYFSWGDASAILPYIVSDANALPDESYFDTVYAASANPDNAERAAGYAEAQKILMDTRCCIPLVRSTALIVHNSKLDGVYIGDNGIMFFNDIK